MIAVALPIAVGTQFVAVDVMRVIAGPEFSDSGPILRVLIWAGTAIFLGNMFAHAIIALEKQKEIIKAYVFVAVSSLVGYLVFIPLFSYYGAAWITIYSEFAIALASYLVIWKNTRFRPDFTVLFKTLIACAIMSTSILFLKKFQVNDLVLTIAIAATVYAFSLYSLKVLTRKEVMELLNKA